tara:strand:- start:255 stop:944 length:690 start_codon:yes stop_codon:yes gene_type:complete
MKLAIIPARVGSKRVPEKNIKPFLGKPIIGYSIETALESNLFDEVMVSTDSDKVADVALSFGAKIPFFRSDKNSDDFATTIDVLLEVLEKYKSIGKTFDEVCCIYPTAPFVSIELLKKCYSLLVKDKYDSVFPVIRYSFPIQRALRKDKNNKMKMIFADSKKTRSQDLTPSFQDSGQFYWFNVKPILTKKDLWTDNTGILEITEMEAHDIDTIEDWKIAEFKYKLAMND